MKPAFFLPRQDWRSITVRGLPIRLGNTFPGYRFRRTRTLSPTDCPVLLMGFFWPTAWMVQGLIFLIYFRVQVCSLQQLFAPFLRLNSFGAKSILIGLAESQAYSGHRRVWDCLLASLAPSELSFFCVVLSCSPLRCQHYSETTHGGLLTVQLSRFRSGPLNRLNTGVMPGAPANTYGKHVLWDPAMFHGPSFSSSGGFNRQRRDPIWPSYLPDHEQHLSVSCQR